MGELARSFNHMADSVEDSFARLEEARQKAEEASRQKSAFLATVSHELRTPLNGILGFAELLKLELGDPEQQEYAAIIHRSGEHLQHLVNEILDLAKIESGEMSLNLAPVNLAGFIEESIAVHRSSAAEKGLALHCELAIDLPEKLTTDATRLRQLLNNLLSNALKFTERGSVTLRVAPAADGMIAFAVSDTGPGIAPEHHAAVFEKFKQLESFLTREHGGSGLGLAIVRQLAEHMGGRVSLESSVGVGSTFTIYLPQGEHHV